MNIFTFFCIASFFVLYKAALQGKFTPKDDFGQGGCIKYDKFPRKKRNEVTQMEEQIK